MNDFTASPVMSKYFVFVVCAVEFTRNPGEGYEARRRHEDMLEN
jgi:hypothetical protein